MKNIIQFIKKYLIKEYIVFLKENKENKVLFGINADAF